MDDDENNTEIGKGTTVDTTRFTERLSVAGIFAMLTFAAFGVVGVSAAMQAADDCGPYGVPGIGGYGCADLTDAELDATQTQDLVDRQTILLIGTKFDPTNALWAASQCLAETVAVDRSDACDTRTTAIAYTNSSGSVTATIRVRRIMTLDGVDYDCAEPELCVIGAGTVTPDFNGAYEGTTLPISFDPDVDPVPPLEAAIVVDDISATSASGTVTCSREATFQIDAQVLQEKAGSTSSAYGYLYDGETSCGASPRTWTVALMPGQRRLTGGPADYWVYFYAFDADGEYVSDQESGSITLTGSGRQQPEIGSIDGDHLAVEVVGTRGRGADQEILVQVTCATPIVGGNVSMQIRQTAGLDYAYGYSDESIDGCDGTTLLSMPVATYTEGRGLAGGPALVSVNAYGYAVNDDVGYFEYDYASTTATTKLRGLTANDAFDPTPNPDSRIVLDSVSPSQITGTIVCDATETIFLNASAYQSTGRQARSAYGYSDESMRCDGPGPLAFTLQLEPELRGGRAALSVSGSGYLLINDGEYDYYEHVWSDYQQAELRVRR